MQFYNIFSGTLFLFSPFYHLFYEYVFVSVFYCLIACFRQASVALNVWQPEIIRGRQKQIVEQCVVPVESRFHSLEMELKLCKQHILGLEKAHVSPIMLLHLEPMVINCCIQLQLHEAKC